MSGPRWRSFRRIFRASDEGFAPDWRHGDKRQNNPTYIVESIPKAAGEPAAVFGTIEYRGPGFDFTAERTTPEAPDLEKLFRQVVDAGWRHTVMESHLMRSR